MILPFSDPVSLGSLVLSRSYLYLLELLAWKTSLISCSVLPRVSGTTSAITTVPVTARTAKQKYELLVPVEKKSKIYFCVLYH